MTSTHNFARHEQIVSQKCQIGTEVFMQYMFVHLLFSCTSYHSHYRLRNTWWTVDEEPHKLTFEGEHLIPQVNTGVSTDFFGEMFDRQDVASLVWWQLQFHQMQLCTWQHTKHWSHRRHNLCWPLCIINSLCYVQPSLEIFVCNNFYPLIFLVFYWFILLYIYALYTVFRKKHPFTFSFISPWVMCRFKQKLQWIYLRNGRFWQCRNWIFIAVDDVIMTSHL